MDIYEIRQKNLNLLIEEAGGRQEFIHKAEKSDAQISQLLRGVRNVGSRLARDMERKCGRPSGWMDIPHSPVNAGNEDDRQLSSSDVVGWEEPSDLPDGRYVFIPRLEVKLSAGNGNVAWEAKDKKGAQAFRLEWLQEKQLNSENLACMKAKGDSMESYIMDGDSLLIDLSDIEVQDGGVYAIRYGDELRVKRLFRRFDNGLKIISDNPDYPDDLVEEDELNNIAIIGRVVWRGG